MEPSHFPAQIETPRLHLKKHDPANAARIFAAVDAERARLGENLGWVQWTQSAEGERAHIVDVLRQWVACEFFDYAMFAGADYLGNIGVHAMNWTTGVCELGYWILGAFEGRGFVGEAAAALTDLCFARGFHRVEIRCTPGNRRSARVAERLGFQLEACLRGSAVDPAGRRQDTLVFAKLEDQTPARAEARPDFITHWAAHGEGDESPYADSLELFGERARLASALGLDDVEVDHLLIPVGRRSWRDGDHRFDGALIYVARGALELTVGAQSYPLVDGDAARLPPGSTLVNMSPFEARALVIRATPARRALGSS